MTPATGQRWTRKGQEDIEVLGVSGGTVRLKQGSHQFTCSVAEYETAAEATLRNDIAANLEDITDDTEI